MQYLGISSPDVCVAMVRPELYPNIRKSEVRAQYFTQYGVSLSEISVLYPSFEYQNKYSKEPNVGDTRLNTTLIYI